MNHDYYYYYDSSLHLALFRLPQPFVCVCVGGGIRHLTLTIAHPIFVVNRWQGRRTWSQNPPGPPVPRPS